MTRDAIVITEDIKEKIMDVKEEINDVDYAILKSINYVNTSNVNDVEKEIRDIAGILQIRVIIVEKHIYGLAKKGLIKFEEYLVMTQKGEDAINKFEKTSKEWMSIGNFVVTNVKNKKERDLKVHNIVDKTLLTVIIILIMLVIYLIIY